MTRKMKWAGLAAFAAAMLYAIPHFWWGLGFSFAFPGDFSQRPDHIWAELIGNWGMGVASTLAALYALRFTRKQAPGPLWYIPAWVGSIGLSLWGFIFFIMQYLLAVGRVVSAPAFAEQDAHPMAVWSYFWYGLFLFWGIALGLAAYQAQRIRKASQA